MPYPTLLSKDHQYLGKDYCSGFLDVFLKWNTGFECPREGNESYCCGTASHKYCCISSNDKVEDKNQQISEYFQRVPVSIALISGVTLITISLTFAFSCFFCSCCMVYKKRQRRSGGIYRFQGSSSINTTESNFLGSTRENSFNINNSRSISILNENENNNNNETNQNQNLHIQSANLHSGRSDLPIDFYNIIPSTSSSLTIPPSISSNLLNESESLHNNLNSILIQRPNSLTFSNTLNNNHSSTSSSNNINSRINTITSFPQSFPLLQNRGERRINNDSLLNQNNTELNRNYQNYHQFQRLYSSSQLSGERNRQNFTFSQLNSSRLMNGSSSNNISITPSSSSASAVPIILPYSTENNLSRLTSQIHSINSILPCPHNGFLLNQNFPTTTTDTHTTRICHSITS